MVLPTAKRVPISLTVEDWFTFKEGEVDAAQLSDALKYVGSDTDI